MQLCVLPPLCRDERPPPRGSLYCKVLLITHRSLSAFVCRGGASEVCYIQLLFCVFQHLCYRTELLYLFLAFFFSFRILLLLSSHPRCTFSSIHCSMEAIKGALSFMEKLNHTNWHSSQALVHGNDVSMHKCHLEKFAISVTPPQIKQRCLRDGSFQISIELVISFEFFFEELIPSTAWRQHRESSPLLRPLPCPGDVSFKISPNHMHHHRNVKGGVNI